MDMDRSVSTNEVGVQWSTSDVLKSLPLRIFVFWTRTPDFRILRPPVFEKVPGSDTPPWQTARFVHQADSATTNPHRLHTTWRNELSKVLSKILSYFVFEHPIYAFALHGPAIFPMKVRTMTRSDYYLCGLISVGTLHCLGWSDGIREGDGFIEPIVHISTANSPVYESKSRNFISQVFEAGPYPTLHVLELQSTDITTEALIKLEDHGV